MKGGESMSKVIVRNGNVDGALRTMKQKNARDGLLKKLANVKMDIKNQENVEEKRKTKV